MTKIVTGLFCKMATKGFFNAYSLHSPTGLSPNRWESCWGAAASSFLKLKSSSIFLKMLSTINDAQVPKLTIACDVLGAEWYEWKKKRWSGFLWVSRYYWWSTLPLYAFKSIMLRRLPELGMLSQLGRGFWWYWSEEVGRDGGGTTKIECISWTRSARYTI